MYRKRALVDFSGTESSDTTLLHPPLYNSFLPIYHQAAMPMLPPEPHDISKADTARMLIAHRTSCATSIEFPHHAAPIKGPLNNQDSKRTEQKPRPISILCICRRNGLESSLLTPHQISIGPPFCSSLSSFLIARPTSP
jgi:hypothetical protein